MGSRYTSDFFKNKREWSVYKDKVLDYYLKPYLAKVATRGKPICVVDMFSGRGVFEDGSPGSPLIIAHHLARIAQSGVPVRLTCIEQHAPYCTALREALSEFAFADVRNTDCMGLIDEISHTTKTHTTFLYIDPCEVSQLDLSRLAAVYRRIQTDHSSVEVIVVFMARAFMRQAMAIAHSDAQVRDSIRDIGSLEGVPKDDWGDWAELLPVFDGNPDPVRVRRAIEETTRVAGGDYWRSIAATEGPWDEKLLMLVEAYEKIMRTWFRAVEAFPINSNEDRIPKYWMIFGTRYPPAIDLFNRACANARRAQEADFTQRSSSLFAGMPFATQALESLVDSELRKLHEPGVATSWQDLRWQVCGGRNIGRFTDSEANAGIKRQIKRGLLGGASGTKIEETALLTWLPRRTP